MAITSTNDALTSTYSSFIGSVTSSCSTCEGMGEGIGQGGGSSWSRSETERTFVRNHSMSIWWDEVSCYSHQSYLHQLFLILGEIRAHLSEGLRRVIVGHGDRGGARREMRRVSRCHEI